MRIDPMHPERQRPLIDEWLRVHRALVAAEAAFTDLAMQAAAGDLPLDELSRERVSLMRLRSHCTEVYERAFPSGVAGSGA
jgi:hypothetical protein